VYELGRKKIVASEDLPGQMDSSHYMNRVLPSAGDGNDGHGLFPVFFPLSPNAEESNHCQLFVHCTLCLNLSMSMVMDLQQVEVWVQSKDLFD